MANVTVSILSISQTAIKIFGYKAIIPIMSVNVNSGQLANGDTVQFNVIGLNFTTTAFAGNYGSSETICNVNIGNTLTETKNNKTMTFRRNSANSFTYSLTFESATTVNESLTSLNSHIFIAPILLTLDGVYFGGYVNKGLLGTFIGATVEYDFFQFITYNEPYNNYIYTTYDTESKNTANDLLSLVIPTDPYAGAGDSTTGGGDGTFDGSSDPVPVPNLPSVGAQDSGFITLFAPTAQQMKDLAHFMWVNPVFDLSAFKKLFADPMDCILGLSVVPVTVPTSGTKNVNIGNLITTVTMNVASQQYIEVDCGTVTMDRYFGSYLDFEPYTKISLFLPYCGTHSLNMDDIAGKTIGIVYHIDILTGSCIAFVKCGDSVLYEFNGACGSNIPVNSLNFASTIENAIRIAVNIGTTVATAGASAPITGANAAARETARKIGTGVSLAGSTAEGALSMKPNVSRSGALGGGVGILGHQIPYFIITRPRLCKPAKQDFFQGYPSFIQTTIGDLIGKGFTSFTDIIISGQYLTDEEETELEYILESGVYL